MSNRLNFENWQTRKKQMADVSRTDENRLLEWFSDKYQFFGMLERSKGFSIEPLKGKAKKYPDVTNFNFKLVLTVSLPNCY
jgi:hypothetical protein